MSPAVTKYIGGKSATVHQSASLSRKRLCSAAGRRASEPLIGGTEVYATLSLSLSLSTFKSRLKTHLFSTAFC